MWRSRQVVIGWIKIPHIRAEFLSTPLNTNNCALTFHALCAFRVFYQKIEGNQSHFTKCLKFCFYPHALRAFRVFSKTIEGNLHELPLVLCLKWEYLNSFLLKNGQQLAVYNDLSLRYMYTKPNHNNASQITISTRKP